MKLHVQTELTQFSCRYEGIVKANEGILSATVKEPMEPDTDSDTFFVELNCESKYPSRIPYGVSIVGSKGQHFSYITKHDEYLKNDYFIWYLSSWIRYIR